MATVTTTARFQRATKDVVASLDPLFPGAKALSEDKRPFALAPDSPGFSESRHMSHLPLQISLFFNVFYLPLWFIATGFIVALKFNRVELIYQILLSTILLVFSFLELFRLYLGYCGNLTEKVPELSGFWLLTLLQIPLLAFYTFYEHFLLLPFERAINFLLLAFLFTQVVFGYVANRNLVRHQLTKFHLLQFTELEEEREEETIEEENQRRPETIYPTQTGPTTTRFRDIKTNIDI